MQIPSTHYALVHGERVAYQVLGDGPTDVIVVREPVVGVDQLWDSEDSAYFHRRLAGSHRLIVCDVRGFGSSDRGGAVRPTWETWCDDLAAVMDATGSERAAIAGMGLAGMIAVLFAATRPERVSSLILVNAFVRYWTDRDYPHGYPPEARDSIRRSMVDGWGTPRFLAKWAPSVYEDPVATAQFGRSQRACLSPGQLLEFIDPNIDRDARPVLGTIRMPTLVVHREGNQVINVGNGRYLAEHIDRAEYVELPGADHYYCAGDVEPLLAAIERFIARAPDGSADGRVLATVLLTDIVGSTARSAAMGDRQWKVVLDQHDAIGRAGVKTHRGRLVKSTGDGLLATFDGPARAIQCAVSFRDAVRDLGLEVRAGVHCAEVELRGSDIGGIGVHVTSRILDVAGSGEVLVSRTVKDLVVGGDVELADHGFHQLAGLPDEYPLYAVTGIGRPQP